MARDLGWVPQPLLHALKHFKVLHEHTALLSVETEDVPHVPAQERLQIRNMGKGIYTVRLRYGFMDMPDVADDLARSPYPNLRFEPMTIGRERAREVVGQHANPHRCRAGVGSSSSSCHKMLGTRRSSSACRRTGWSSLAVRWRSDLTVRMRLSSAPPLRARQAGAPQARDYRPARGGGAEAQAGEDTGGVVRGSDRPVVQTHAVVSFDPNPTTGQ